MKYLLSVLLFIFTSVAYGGSGKKDFFLYEYHLSKSITFDFTKDWSVTLGTIKLINKENKKKKFRYYSNSPYGHFFNKKTGKKKHLDLVIHNPGERKMDSLFWALLDSATYYYPVQPHGTATLTAYLNPNTYPRPQEMIEYIAKNHKDLEYRIFNPSTALTAEGKPIGETENPRPVFVIYPIKVIPCKHEAFCQF